MLVIEINQRADVAAQAGSAPGSHVLPLTGCFGAHRGQAQLADAPRESLPSQHRFGADFYVIKPQCSDKCVNKSESPSTHPQWLP